MKCVSLLATLMALIAAANCFKDGAPDTTCDHMIPQHQVEPQTSLSPYTVKVSSNKIAPGGKVIVTISGKNTFKGFFVQARVGSKAIGQFEQAPGSKLVNCHGSAKSGITHVNSSEKKTISLTWNAPKGLSETVRFWVTTVQDGGHFWVGQKSQAVTVA